MRALWVLGIVAAIALVFPAAARGTDADAAPELISLKELPAGQHSGPWLSPDGLTLYWQSIQPGERQRWIWSAERKDSSSLFEKFRKLVPGNDPTVSGDGLEMILLDAGSLQVATRKSRDEAFSRPRKIAEFDDLGFLAGPALSEDGLILYAERPGKEFLRFSRRSRQDPWGRPAIVSIRAPELAPLRFLSTSAEGKYGFCAFGGLPRRGAPGNLLLLASREDGLVFDSPAWLRLPGTTLVGQFPRYVAATRELFFSAPGDQPGTVEIRAIRNFDPATMTAPVR